MEAGAAVRAVKYVANSRPIKYLTNETYAPYIWAGMAGIGYQLENLGSSVQHLSFNATDGSNFTACNMNNVGPGSIFYELGNWLLLPVGVVGLGATYLAYILRDPVKPGGGSHIGVPNDGENQHIGLDSLRDENGNLIQVSSSNNNNNNNINPLYQEEGF